MIYLTSPLEEILLRLHLDQDLVQLTLAELQNCLESFEGNELATSVFLKKYALRDENGKILETTLSQAQARWAEAIASADTVPASYFSDLYQYFIPGGRQMVVLGNPYIEKATAANCYTTVIPDDSLEDIFSTAYRIAKTFSYGGGQGVCIGTLRPAGAKVSNTARQSTGPLSFAGLYSALTGVIGQHARRGALIITCPIDHPNIREFITAKTGDPQALRYVNLSVKISDTFMKAVEEDTDFQLTFNTRHATYKETVRARDLWNLLVTKARDSAEPGVLFWGTIKHFSPSEIYPELVVSCCNACSEIPLEDNGACMLGALILDKFIVNPYTRQAQFNFPLFIDMITKAIRHLDNAVTLNLPRHPLPEQKTKAEQGRRIGLGVTGLADTLLALGLRYGSDEALQWIDNLFRLKREHEYKASVNLAGLRGSFPVFDPSKHYNQPFTQKLPDYLQSLGKKQGQRNVTISAVAPVGSGSIIAMDQNGIEPIFCRSYQRYIELGAERQAFKVVHPSITRCFATLGKTEGEKYLEKHLVTAHQVAPIDRVTLQATIQKYVDSAISSTVNLPSDVSVETVSDIYMSAWKAGLKGITVYREGSREGIMVSSNAEIPQHSALPDRAIDTVPYCVRAEGGDKFYIHVSYRNRDLRMPYQVFIVNYKSTENDSFIKLGNALIRLLRDKGVPEEKIEQQLSRSPTTLVKVARFLSLGLKLGFLEGCVNVLEGRAMVGSLASKLHAILLPSIGRSKTCPSCGSTKLQAVEGCVQCLDCGSSGCS